MSDRLEKRVRNALIVGGIILGSLITGVKVADYYIMLSNYKGMETVRGKEYTRNEAKICIYEYSLLPLPLKILHLDKVKASETYLKNSSGETSKF